MMMLRDEKDKKINPRHLLKSVAENNSKLYNVSMDQECVKPNKNKKGWNSV